MSSSTRDAAVSALVPGLLVAGTVLYVLPSALHGNPPVDSAADTLAYVSERPSWRVVHLVNIGAVLVWLAAFGLLTRHLGGRGETIARYATHVFVATTAVFAVYFSLHAFGLSAAAAELPADGVAPTALLERTEALLLVLGAIAFTAQAMLGLVFVLYGTAIALSNRLPSWVGWSGAVAGAGWLVGALIVEFAVIVPFTVLIWAWTIVLAVVLVRGRHAEHLPGSGSESERRNPAESRAAAAHGQQG